MQVADRKMGLQLELDQDQRRHARHLHLASPRQVLCVECSNAVKIVFYDNI